MTRTQDRTPAFNPLAHFTPNDLWDMARDLRRYGFEFAAQECERLAREAEGW